MNTKSSTNSSKRIDWANAIIGAVLGAILGFAASYLLMVIQEPGDEKKLEEMRQTNAQLKATNDQLRIANIHLDSIIVGTKTQATALIGQTQAVQAEVANLASSIKNNATPDQNAIRIVDNLSTRVESIANSGRVIAKAAGVQSPGGAAYSFGISGDQLIEIPKSDNPRGGGRTGMAFDKHHSVGVRHEIGQNEVSVLVDGSEHHMHPGGQYVIDDSKGKIAVIYKGLDKSNYLFEIAHVN